MLSSIKITNKNPLSRKHAVMEWRKQVAALLQITHNVYMYMYVQVYQETHECMAETIGVQAARWNGKMVEINSV